MAVLAAVNIGHSYGERVILQDVNLSLAPGERIGIVGRNGTGKSTLMKVLCGRLKPDVGSVNVQRGARAGYLQQEHQFAPGETLKGAAEAGFA